ncbi:DMT family transporter [Actinomycetospora soli]|uniref:DMT family transporter n=1 Tax=Actinomycetospora soli TaxID=2893887 RepID=UPI001E50BDF1|nr:DMT family transporter [Actinomycetospora soli]MCD2188453.1 DMT family transporter [Actinomycetospora soli]
MTGLAVTLALFAALLLAVGSVAQRRAAGEVPDDEAGGLGLLRRLVRSPVWWAGSVGDAGGFVVQAAALGVGSLLLVQPLLVTTLLFALPLEAWTGGRRITARDAVWALVLAAALALFLVIGEPTAGEDRAPFAAWVPTGSVLLVVLAACLLLAARRHGRVRAAALAVATGIAYGVLAALTKSVVDLLTDGVLPLLLGWETWVLVVAAVGGTYLQQAAFQAGDLATTLPAITVAEPLVAALLGLTVLGEQVRADGAEWVLIGVLVVVTVVATTVLARSSAARTPDPAPA